MCQNIVILCHSSQRKVNWFTTVVVIAVVYGQVYLAEQDEYVRELKN